MALTSLSAIKSATGLSYNDFSNIVNYRPGKGTANDYFTKNPSLDPNKMADWSNWSYVATAQITISSNSLATITPAPGTYTYNIGQTISLSCVLKGTSGRYRFNGWYANGALISTAQYPNYTVTGNATLSVSITDTYTRYYTQGSFAGGASNFCINSSPVDVVNEYYAAGAIGLYLYTWPYIDPSSHDLVGTTWTIYGVDSGSQYVSGNISSDPTWGMNYQFTSNPSDTGFFISISDAGRSVMDLNDIILNKSK